MLSANEHVPIEIDENEANVGAQFHRLAQIGHKHNLVQLSHIGLANGRAEIVTQSVHTTVDGIEEENGAVEAVEFGVQTHVVVELVLHLVLLVPSYLPDYQAVEIQT